MEQVKLVQVGQNLTLVVDQEKMTKKIVDKEERESVKTLYKTFEEAKGKKKEEILKNLKKVFTVTTEKKKENQKVAKKIEKNIKKEKKSESVILQDQLSQKDKEIADLKKKLKDMESKSKVSQPSSNKSSSPRSGEY